MELLFQTLVLSLSNVSVYVLLGTSVTLLYGVLGVLNFAQGDLMTLSSYLTYWLVVGVGLGWLATSVLLVPALALVGVVFYVSVLRPLERHDHALILVGTFGAGLLLQGVIQMTFGGAPVGIHRDLAAWTVGGVTVPRTMVVSVVLATACLAIMAVVLGKTRFGRETRALAQSRLGASLSGINTTVVRAGAVIMSVLLAGVAGVVIAQTTVLVPTVGFSLVLKAFAVAIVAGIGRAEGLLPAALILGFTEGLVGGYVSASLAEAAIFSAVILTLLVRPEGIVRARMRA